MRDVRRPNLAVASALCAGLLGLTGCLSDPELKSCAEFEFGTEGCGSACEVYCEFMLDSCSEIYESEARCMNDCANEPVTDFVEGQLGDRDGNSLACRISFGREGSCEQASLRTTTECVGASCEDYCSLMMTHCEGAYPSVDNCKATCADLPRGDLGPSANTVECRFAAAERAMTDPSACDAASFGGGDVCGDVCEVYCDFQEKNCATAANFMNRAECMQTCDLLDDEGSFDDWDFSIEADTVQCRLYHAGPPAALEPGVHCPHSGIYNSLHCGIDPALPLQPPTWPCVTYCALVLENCPGVYADNTACQLACATIPEVLSADPARGPDIYPVSSTECPM